MNKLVFLLSFILIITIYSTKCSSSPLWNQFRHSLINTISRRPEWCNGKSNCGKISNTIFQIITEPTYAKWSNKDKQSLNNYLCFASSLTENYKAKRMSYDGKISKLYENFVYKLSSENKKLALQLYIKLQKNKPNNDNICYNWEEIGYKSSQWFQTIKTKQARRQLRYQRILSFDKNKPNQNTGRNNSKWNTILRDLKVNKNINTGFLREIVKKQVITTKVPIKSSHYKSKFKFPIKPHFKFVSPSKKTLKKVNYKFPQKQHYQEYKKQYKKQPKQPKQQTEKHIKYKTKTILSDSNTLSSRTVHHYKYITKTIVVKGNKFIMNLYAQGIQKFDIQPSQKWFDKNVILSKDPKIRNSVNKVFKSLGYKGLKGKFPLLPKSIYLVYKPRFEIIVSKSIYDRLKRALNNRRALGFFVSSIQFNNKKVRKLSDDYDENEFGVNEIEDEIRFTEPVLKELKEEENKKTKEFKKEENKKFNRRFILNDDLGIDDTMLNNYFDGYLNDFSDDKILSDALSERRRRTRHVTHVITRKKYVYEGDYKVEFISNNEVPQVLGVVSDIL